MQANQHNHQVKVTKVFKKSLRFTRVLQLEEKKTLMVKERQEKDDEDTTKS